jgi:DNA-binding MarR family transcriptional regulator
MIMQGLELAREAIRILVTELDATMPLRVVLVFLTIAELTAKSGQPPDMREVGDRLGLSSAAMSRDVGILSTFSRANEGGGLGVVEAQMDLTDRRRRQLVLTPRGKELVARINKRLSK